MVRHRWISQDGKACLLASWFLSRDVAVHSGVVGASAPAPRCFKFRRKTRPGDPGGTTTADATVWQNPCSAAGGLCVVRAEFLRAVGSQHDTRKYIIFESLRACLMASLHIRLR